MLLEAAVVLFISLQNVFPVCFVTPVRDLDLPENRYEETRIQAAVKQKVR